MVAFYAFTDMQLINAANIKRNCCADESGDLFIQMAERMSLNLIQAIENAGIFDRVYYIDPPLLLKRKWGFLGKLPKLWLFGYISAHKKYYKKVLNNYEIDQKKYDTFFVSGYWADALSLLDYFYRHNCKMKVVLYEEGIGAYYHTRKELCQHSPDTISKKARLQRTFIYYREEKKFRRLPQMLYLYRPELYHEDKRLQTQEIPVISVNNPCFTIMDKLYSSTEQSYVLRYSKKKVYFFAMHTLKGYEDNHDRTYTIIDAALEELFADDFLIRAHPEGQVHREEYGAQYESKVYIDRTGISLEPIFSQIDIENKIFIGRQTAAIMYPKYMFGKEPYVIFTYRLYQEYYRDLDEITERYALDLQSTYSDPCKVMIPRTVQEFKNDLSRIYHSMF